MLHRPLLSGRVGKWAYELIEYDLAYKSLKFVMGQIVADFLVEHRIDSGHSLDLKHVSLVPWKLFFDGSNYSNGQGLGIVYISPHGTVYEASSSLDYFCTNNQAEYATLLFGLELLIAIGATHIEAFGDSLLVFNHISKVYQRNKESLNLYIDKCLDIIYTLDTFSIAHVSR